MTTVTLRPLFHRSQEGIGIYFPFDPFVSNLVKTVPSAKWSRTHTCWYIPLQKEHYQSLLQTINKKAVIENSELKRYLQQRKAVMPAENKPVTKATVNLILTYPLSPPNTEALQIYRELLLLKVYSPKTIHTYCNAFHHLLCLLKERNVAYLSKEEVMSYLLWLVTKQGYSEIHIHTVINAIKFYYEKVLGRQSEFYDVSRPKKPHKLPEVLATEEVVSLIGKVDNMKHKAMLMTGYSAGLRISEIVTLKIRDIDSKRMMIHIHGAKGKKDRLVPLSQKLLVILREYVKEYKPKEFLFEGQSGGAYHTRSLQKIMMIAKARAGIRKKGSLHSLRHSYATHLMEGGTDIRFIQELLGHNSITTTMRYTHVSKKDIGKIGSPLDKLSL